MKIYFIESADRDEGAIGNFVFEKSTEISWEFLSNSQKVF